MVVVMGDELKMRWRKTTGCGDENRVGGVVRLKKRGGRGGDSDRLVGGIARLQKGRREEEGGL